jgi:membrane fusion protein, multidrug efflux system
MATGSAPAPAPALEPRSKPEQVAPHPSASAPADVTARLHHGFRKYLTPMLVLLLAAAVVITITRNWNAWEGGRIQQVTDDAYVRSDLTPLSTKVAGLVREVHVADYQTVNKGDLIVELEHDDYQAQVGQAKAAVEAAKAAIENNRQQRQLQNALIDRAMAGIDLAKAQISAAQAGKEAVQADVVRTRAERVRQEALYQTHSTTQQKLEQATADEGRFTGQFASREADWEQAKTSLRSNELAVLAEQRKKSVLESQESQLIADLHAKEAALEVAQVNLGYTKITAPGNGSVGERQVRPGQLVSPGTQVLTFVSNVKWVQANYRETQLTHIKVGDPAEITVDTFPGQKLHGKVLEIAPASGSQFALLPPDNATGNFTKVVQRIPVKIALDSSPLSAQLRPGLSVTATVRTKH